MDCISIIIFSAISKCDVSPLNRFIPNGRSREKFSSHAFGSYMNLFGSSFFVISCVDFLARHITIFHCFRADIKYSIPRSPLTLLQWPQSNWRFWMWSVPPLFLAMMWSISKCWVWKCVLHPLQLPPCSPYSFILFSVELYFGILPKSVRFGTSFLWMISQNKTWTFLIRLTTSSPAFGDMSIPIHFRFNFSATTQVVAQPHNGSKSMSPSL